jgi:hypothetical protein
MSWPRVAEPSPWPARGGSATPGWPLAEVQATPNQNGVADQPPHSFFNILFFIKTLKNILLFYYCEDMCLICGLYISLN